MDNTNCVWITYNTVGGHKVSICKESAGQALAELRELVGDIAVNNFKNSLVNSLGSGDKPKAADVDSPEAPGPAPSELVDEMGQEFEMCPTHNKPKDKWVPPGTSRRTGKAYAGFWACPERH